MGYLRFSGGQLVDTHLVDTHSDGRLCFSGVPVLVLEKKGAAWYRLVNPWTPWRSDPLSWEPLRDFAAPKVGVPV